MSFLDEYRDKFEEEGGPPFYYESPYFYDAKDTKLYKTIAEELETIKGINKKDNSDTFLPLFYDKYILLTTSKYDNIGVISFKFENVYAILDYKLIGRAWSAFLESYKQGAISSYRILDKYSKVEIPFTFADLSALLISQGF